MDLFATNMNYKLPLYFSPVPDPNALEVDALITSWSGLSDYAYPPIPLVRATLNKLLKDGAEVILIAQCGQIRNGFRTYYPYWWIFH